MDRCSVVAITAGERPLCFVSALPYLILVLTSCWIGLTVHAYSLVRHIHVNVPAFLIRPGIVTDP